MKVRDYDPGHVNDWCRGCGDYGILRALQKALAALALRPEEVMLFGGIGCSGKTPYYLRACSIHTLHGRVLPFATGAKLANPALTVIAAGGDGDGLSIGAGHFVNAGRRNLDLTYLFYNNEVYGLTKGQASPTLAVDAQTRSMPQPNPQRALDPLRLALEAGYTWIGRGYAYAVDGLAELIQQAIRHPGLAFLEILQPCPHYNDLHDRDWYDTRIRSLEASGHDPRLGPDDPPERVAALREAIHRHLDAWPERIGLGVLLADSRTPPFAHHLHQRQPAWPALPPCAQPVLDEGDHSRLDLEPLLHRFTI